MKLITATSDGLNQFTMEVGDSDTVFKIKQKIQRLTGVPISCQTLGFNGVVLPNYFNLRHTQIVDGSTIDLHLPHFDADELDQIEANLQMELDRLLRDYARLGLISPPTSDQTLIQTHAAAGNQPPTTIHQQPPPTMSGPIFELNIPRQFPTVERPASSPSADQTLIVQTHAAAGDEPPTAISSLYTMYAAGRFSVIHPSPIQPVANFESTPSSSSRSLISGIYSENISDQSEQQNGSASNVEERDRIKGKGVVREDIDIPESSGTSGNGNVEDGSAAAPRRNRQLTVHGLATGREIQSMRRPLIVVVIYNLRRRMVEVRPEEQVSVLRERLVRIGFEVPPTLIHIFIHRHSIMDEDKSFEHHHVEQGDYIQLLPANVL